MMHRFSFLGALLIIFLPSFLKIVFLRAMGAKIGRGCYIGCSLLDARHLVMGDYVRIGHLNLMHRLTNLELQDGSKIEALNWITGGSKGGLHLGQNSSIRRMHFFEASGTVRVGDNTIIAGRGSLFFTHGQSPSNLDDVRAIQVGNWCYVGAAARFTPGSRIEDYCFVAMGAVVVKAHAETHVVIGGSPGRVIKRIPADSLYFQRRRLVHAHHPDDWNT